MTGLVALHLPPAQMLESLTAVWEAGDAALPLPWQSSDDAIARIMGQIRPRALLTASPTGPERVSLDLAQPVPGDCALVITTSGSTGAPKGVALSHDAVRASTQASLHRLGARSGDRFALALPLHHVAGLQVALRSWACGTEPEILATVDPEAVATASGRHVSLVPTQLRRLLDAPGETILSRWSSILVGGAAASSELLAAARRAGANVITSYGMTETCGGCVYDGRALDGVEIAVRDDGRVRLRGNVLFSGYLGDPAATAAAIDQDGWLVTGDRGRLEDGRLNVLGRIDDVIITGGENVSAGAVADAIGTHPRVADVAVVGQPDTEWGEIVVAVVVPIEGSQTLAVNELRDHVRASLPTVYAPRRLVLTSQLPRDGMGKVSVEQLRKLIEGYIE